MVEAVDGQSILLAKLRTNALPLQDENKIIMTLFRRSCCVSFETSRSQTLVQIREELNKIKSRLDEQGSSQLNLIGKAEDLAQKSIVDMLQMERLDHLIEMWDQSEKSLKDFAMSSEQNRTPHDKITKLIENYIRTHKQQVDSSIKIIQYLKMDISLVLSVATDKWNHAILEDIFRLVLFFLATFPKLSEKSKFGQGSMANLRQSLESLEILWRKLCVKHKDFIDVSKLEGSERIPAKSIRELYVFNEVSQRVLQGRLMLVAECDMQEKANEIRKIFKHPVQLAGTDNLHKKGCSRAFTLLSTGRTERANTMILKRQPGFPK